MSLHFFGGQLAVSRPPEIGASRQHAWMDTSRVLHCHARTTTHTKVLDSLEQMLQRMLGHESSSSAVQRRKRKKRRKRRTPRTSSRSSCGRARRRQRQWHTRFAGFPGDVPHRAVFPSVVVRPEMLCIMAVMNQKDSTTLVVQPWQWHVQGLVSLGTMHLALCSLLASPSPRCSASWPVWTRL